MDLDDDADFDLSWDDDLIEGQEMGILELQSDISGDMNPEKGYTRSATETEIKKMNASKFYYDVNMEEELQEDILSEDLEDLSQDEIQDDHSNLLEEDNREVSKIHADNIQEQINTMVDMFSQISNTLEGNLGQVQQYVKTLQQSKSSADKMGYPKI
jgi:hypothetical protein